MTPTTMSPPPLARTTRSGPSSLLFLAGGLLIFMTFMRYSLPELAWVVFAPLLVLLHQRGSLGRHLAVLATLVIAFLAAISKMAAPEIPWVPVPMFAVPIAISYFIALAFVSLAHRRLGVRWGIYSFASAAVAMGWIQYTFTPASSWGMLAHTQLDNLPLVQLAPATGIGGITFLVALGSGLAAGVWSTGFRALRLDFLLFAMALFSALVCGQLRLGKPAPGAMVRVAGVVSPVTHKEFREAVADLESLRRWDGELFVRSARAADLGAQVVVWNEMATLVSVAGEDALTTRGRAFAMDRGVMLLMA